MEIEYMLHEYIMVCYNIKLIVGIISYSRANSSNLIC